MKKIFEIKSFDNSKNLNLFNTINKYLNKNELLDESKINKIEYIIEDNFYAAYTAMEKHYKRELSKLRSEYFHLKLRLMKYKFEDNSNKKERINAAKKELWERYKKNRNQIYDDLKKHRESIMKQYGKTKSNIYMNKYRYPPLTGGTFAALASSKYIKDKFEENRYKKKEKERLERKKLQNRKK